MLLLGRKSGQQVRITLEDGRIINVIVAGLSNGQCRLGFEGDSTIIIDRLEVAERKDSQ